MSSTSKSSTDGPTVASHPFDLPEADVILRSCDGVDFRVFKLLLSLASPVFKQMFSLPQPLLLDAGSVKDSVPVVHLAEDSKIIQKLLPWCYPMWLENVEIPVFGDVDEIAWMLEITRKYDMEPLFNRARTALQPMCTNHPLRVFAVTVQFALSKECQDAAFASLKMKTDVFLVSVLKLKWLSHELPLQLLKYRSKCTKVALAVVPDISDSFGGCWNRCKTDQAVTIGWGGRTICGAPWWIIFMHELKIQLLERPHHDAVQSCDLTINRTTCYSCGNTLKRDMECFVNKLRQGIEDAISKIKYECLF